MENKIVFNTVFTIDNTTFFILLQWLNVLIIGFPKVKILSYILNNGLVKCT